ncbi:hypothetical protein ACWDYK_15710 [Streptomyces anthocyanicus]|uniref:hypothetical protein n=1 Tax=Streptomyces anthocyanicus TaxID=68174 RepID=UPI002F907CB0|nr:hypothetical protein OHA15_41760 [Streptomyces anthocyanicus]
MTPGHREQERTDGYRAAAVPEVGTFLVAASLRVVDGETALSLPGQTRLPDRYVQHHLIPERDGEMPVWWDSYDEPGRPSCPVTAFRTD